jgi:demethylmenaquinone methyltransferase/2-methoxy-6-polyprenyl-1,4-benzoquinol methylase
MIGIVTRISRDIEEAAPGSAPAWTDRELAGNPHANSEKADKVRRMFGAIAHAYDLNNRVHSFGRDQAWRRVAVRMAEVTPTDEVLDVACGTGDLTRAFADANPRRVVGLDFTEPMLEIARTRRLGPKRSSQRIIEYVQGDALNLPYPDASFDILSIAFGIRNVADPEGALREFRRVLRPGGRLIILEFSQPRFGPLRWATNLYCDHILPHTATLISRDRSGAYHYLPRSIFTFLDRDELVAAMEGAGFGGVTQRVLTLGVCISYRGVVR